MAHKIGRPVGSRKCLRRKPNANRARITRAFGASTGNFGLRLNGGLGHESVEGRRIRIQHLGAKRFDVKLDRGFYVLERRFEGIALTDHDPFDSDRISHVAVRVLFHDDLQRPHPSNLPRTPYLTRVKYENPSREPGPTKPTPLVTPAAVQPAGDAPDEIDLRRGGRRETFGAGIGRDFKAA